jgi:hypothetical protein
MTAAEEQLIAQHVAQFNAIPPQGGSCIEHSLALQQALNRPGLHASIYYVSGGPLHCMVLILVNGERFFIDVTASQFEHRLANPARFANPLHLRGIWSDAEYTAFITACDPKWSV